MELTILELKVDAKPDAPPGKPVPPPPTEPIDPEINDHYALSRLLFCYYSRILDKPH